MKAVLLLLVLLPLCLAGFKIKCYGEDFLMVRNQVLHCSGSTQQACYTRVNGDKGCARLDLCGRDGWTCCFTNLCNA